MLLSARPMSLSINARISKQRSPDRYASTIKAWSRNRVSFRLPAGSRLLQDLGFVGFMLPDVETLVPMKKPRGQVLTPDSNAQIGR